jgi:hypothetical protein
VRRGEEAGMLWSHLEEQGIMGGYRLCVDETEGHNQHEGREINQKAKAVSRVHAKLPVPVLPSLIPVV